MDITISRPYQPLVEPATITVSTVLGSLLMEATVTRIVQRRTAELHAGTLAVSTATITVADTTGPPADLQGEHTTVCTTLSTVLGKLFDCVLFIIIKRQLATRERLSASVLSICSSVCLSPKCKKTVFSKTKQFRNMVSIGDL